MKPEAKEETKPELEPRPKKRLLRILTTILVLALVGFIAFDGYVNRWGVFKSFLHWNSLEVRGKDGSRHVLKAGKDFNVIRIDDVQNILSPESLDVVDRPYRTQGLYRMYFRMSDSSSARMQRLYQTLHAFDTTGRMTRTIDDLELAYRGLRKALHLDSTSRRDTTVRTAADSAKFLSSTSLSFGSDQDVSRAFSRLMSNPQLLVGIGIGAAASFGIGLLEGDAFIATAESDVFYFDSIEAGPRSAMWEGKPIDILWTLAKEDTSQSGVHAHERSLPDSQTLRNPRQQ